MSSVTLIKPVPPTSAFERTTRSSQTSSHVRFVPKCGHSRMLKHIAEFFAIEKDIRGRSAEERRLIRQQRGRPLADAFQKWLRT